MHSLNAQTLPYQTSMMKLWDNEVPHRIESNEKEIQQPGNIFWYRKVQIPAIEIFLPSKANATGQAVLVCPGGGYGGLAYDWEGSDIAKVLNAKGIAAFVLKYRLPNSKAIVNRHQVPLSDAQRALRTIRYKAKDWNIDSTQIGILGFSAGGHLASSLGTHFEEEVYPVKDDIDAISGRPDFMVLVYPVITFQEPHLHSGSKNALLGDDPDASLVEHFSNELQVKSNTPPTFLIHAGDDKAVPVENSLLFYQALKAKDIPVEMHIYPSGGHGFSLALDDPHLSSWMERVLEWIKMDK